MWAGDTDVECNIELGKVFDEAAMENSSGNPSSGFNDSVIYRRWYALVRWTELFSFIYWRQLSIVVTYY